MTKLARDPNTKPLDCMADFPYLGRTDTYNTSDWVALYAKLRKVQKHWGVVAKVLIQTEFHMKVQDMLYKAVVQMVFLYGCEIWVVTDAIITVL